MFVTVGASVELTHSTTHWPFLQHHTGFVIVDASGRTVNLNAYAGVNDPGAAKPRFEEIAVPQCHFHGSMSVTLNAEKFLQELLADSRFYDDLGFIIDRFDKTMKMTFKTDQEPIFIPFSGSRENELDSSDVAQFFNPSVQCVVNGVLEQQRTASKPISHVVLVGGFSTNEWLFHQVSQALEPAGLKVTRPASHANRAVSHGAMLFYLNRSTSTVKNSIPIVKSVVLVANAPVAPPKEAQPDHPDITLPKATGIEPPTSVQGASMLTQVATANIHNSQLTTTNNIYHVSFGK
ncbi:hypothetical protein FA15DRAFT_711356 [Coprinopsis marcescibilis]|uniref:Actin-like ATPase domain-containing protein n=1 Tax=Coprinopsis marcescibilis TaxID=230819 RepID=A0A5C3KB34_COPMA|nr:hypothetical protein FA15DRAFT_711356 [Coprinopsis marcescibilis]